MYRIGFFVVVVLAVGLGLVVGALNHTVVQLDLLWFQLQWPLGLALLAALAVGLLLGMLLVWLFSVFPLQMQLRKLRKSPASGSGYPDIPQ